MEIPGIQHWIVSVARSAKLKKAEKLDVPVDAPMDSAWSLTALSAGIDQGELARLVAGDHAISTRWITDEELAAQPELVRTLSVQPPKGAGRVRLLEIEGVDLQPCGGTHLKSTGEVGRVRIGKVEKKGRHNRRVNLHLDD